MSERPRVAILHQGFIPHYRAPFFEMLNEQGLAEYVVFHGAPPTHRSTAAKGPFPFPNRWVDNHEISILGWMAIYQPVIQQIMTGDYDAVVLGHELKFLSSIALALLGPLRGVRVLYWGFGYHVKWTSGYHLQQAGRGSALDRWKTAIAAAAKNALARRADGYLAYTEAGAEHLDAIGVARERVFVLRNTIDTSTQIRLHGALKDADPKALREELDLEPGSVVFLYVGRLVEAKRVGDLIEAVKRINGRQGKRAVEAVIIGDGPMRESLERQAGDDPAISFRGEILDPAVVARYMKASAAVVIPGFVGLAVNHAFAQGRPIITRNHDLHAPEVEYVVNGRNGLIVGGDLDAFADALERFASSPEQRAQLCDGALKTREELRLEHMVEQFDLAVRTITAGSPRP